MRLQETRVLADNVHDVTGDDGLVIFATLHLGQAKKILDDSHEEPLLRLFVHGQGNRTNGPAKHVAVVPRPFSAVNLACQLLGHDVLRVGNV
ncbi:hypothetical protein HYQ46_003062 [Verticillium longisporum]|nr:hypothetical protein HYQ46_003062 [Verticillium longisporum]